MTTLERPLPMLRWSATVRCARQAVYNGTGAPARERTEKEERSIFRGRRIGRDYADWLEANHGEVHVRREVQVEWFGGIGHMDVFLVPTGTVIEVLSSAHASEAMRHVKLLQAVGYLEHYPEGKNAMLVVLNPSTFEEDRTVVVKGTSAYDELLEQVHARVDEIKRFAETGELPDRVCRKPSEAIGRFCLHAQYCFKDWEPPPPDTVSNDPATVELVRKWWDVKQREKVAAEAVAEAEKERKALQDELAGLLPAGKHQAGAYLVKRTDISRSPTLDLKKALLAGVVDEEILGPYMKPGAVYSTWAVEFTGKPADLPEHDYGDTPF